MSGSDDRSKREKPATIDRETIKQEARRLRQKQGWNPHALATEQPLETMQRLNQEQANKKLYEDEARGACEACEDERVRSGDDTALCERHLAEAMGF